MSYPRDRLGYILPHIDMLHNAGIFQEMALSNVWVMSLSSIDCIVEVNFPKQPPKRINSVFYT